MGKHKKSTKGLTLVSGNSTSLVFSYLALLVTLGVGVSSGYLWGHSSSPHNMDVVSPSSNTTHVLKTTTSGVSTDISDISSSGNKEFQFVITNSSKSSPFKFNYTGDHTYKYAIKNSKGKVVYTSFGGQPDKNLTLSPSKSIYYNIDITNEYKKLSSGDYILDVWSTSSSLKSTTTSISYTKGGSQTTSIINAVVTFIGEESKNSFEASNSKGIKNVYYINSANSTMIKNLKDGDKLQLDYKYSGNDKLVTSLKVLKK